MPDLPSHKTVGALRTDAISRLRLASETPELDVDLILGHVTGMSRAALLAGPDREMSPEQTQAFELALERRIRDEPVAYIVESRGFRRIELYVDERVLTPRPETERLVEIALDALAVRPGPRSVIDVGTGSGAIALAIADELGPSRPDVEITGADVSEDALDVARENRGQLDLVGRVKLIHADLLAGLDGPFDVMIANLPYLRPDQQHPSITYEPDVALYSGGDGFDHYRRFLNQARTRLAPDGLLAFEIDPSLRDLACEEVRSAFGVVPKIEVDLAGLERTVILDLANVDSD